MTEDEEDIRDALERLKEPTFCFDDLVEELKTEEQECP